MESSKINELMANRGYTQPIGAIFSKWEFVKDEILLPGRKAGSGNGTSHVYLLEDNMPLFRKCFPEYFSAVDQKSANSDALCPLIKHFVLTSNILTVAGFAYLYYNCDANIFNYSDYVGKVMRHDDSGMLTFDSLFKLSTENRPYFKQFDRLIFGKIIRYIFVPRQTAYKLYLFGDDDYKNFAAFWIIGQIPDNSFIIEGKHDIKPYDIELPDIIAAEAPIVYEDKEDKDKAKTNVSQDPKSIKNWFKKYIKSRQRSDRTAQSYSNNLRRLIPIAQKMLDGQDHPSPYTITDLEQLKQLERDLFSNPKVVVWNHEGHNCASASLRMYISMYEDHFIQIDDTDTNTSTPEPSNQSCTDFNLTSDEESQMDMYFTYLKEVKGKADITCTSYTNALQKRLSNVLREFYNADIHNIFSIVNYKELMKMENEIWIIPQVIEANNHSKGRLSAAFHAYMEFVESTLSDEELATMIFS